MLESQITSWSDNSPRILVGGVGPLAAVLGQVLGGPVIPLDSLEERAPHEDSGGEMYHLLEGLHSVILILPLSARLADVARWLDIIWGMVERFSSMGDQHDLRWVLVPVDSDLGTLGEGLGAVLAVPTVVRAEAELARHGYAIWCPQQSLEDLGRVWQSTLPNDLLTLRARRNQDGRRRALGALLGALQGGNPDAVAAAANEVAIKFPNEQGFLLDVFCRPPSHPNGGKLRRWLAEIVTLGVTPRLCSSSRSEVEGWLLPELAPPP